MKRYVAALLRRPTIACWALVGLAWAPILWVVLFHEDSWGKLVALGLAWWLGILFSLLGSLAGAIAVIMARKKGHAAIPWLANLATLLLFVVVMV